MLPRLAVRHYVPPTPSHADLSKLYGKWYFRALWWFLRKLGAEYQDRIPESWPMQVVEIQQASLFEMIDKSKKAMELLWEKRATTLVLGYDEMDRLLKETPTEMLHLGMSVAVAKDQVTHAVGLRIVLVPWLSGWALLPDLDK